MKYKLINGQSALDVNALTWNPVYISYNFVIFLTRIDYPWLALSPYLSGDFNFILKCLITFIACLWQFEFRDFLFAQKFLRLMVEMTLKKLLSLHLYTLAMNRKQRSGELINS